ncbi:low specificity L-threonine aldolase [Moraxella nasibovis]|uniref:threonine aldolase family protein n=1 Tax=Moraxella nasibovis TaxID=2904120 RepID=UPI0024101558|nr:low specificity L-threonine aldolase [Moraxella nasibovis]WFF39005.1 low specificity L-threonine aldolase [Moraxella nasibovis]
MMNHKNFASDNYSGVHPAIMQALATANVGHVPAYGYDEFTDELQTVIRQHFGDKAHALPVFNGTGANVVGLQAINPRWGAVICTESAHIHQDESTAPQVVGGLKLLAIATDDGKLTPELIKTQLYNIGSEHRAQPSVVYISQTTEYGTCYTTDELKAICQTAHEYGMKVFVDGARLSNAAAYLGISFKEMICETGVDMVSFGGTKNGMMMGECLVVFDETLAKSLVFLRKVGLQTASKMRFISAQFIELLRNDLYLHNAKQANDMATLLAGELDKLGIQPIYQVQSNGVFVKLSKQAADAARQKYAFYDWDTQGTVRLMCSFDTTSDDVLDLASLIKQA